MAETVGSPLGLGLFLTSATRLVLVISAHVAPGLQPYLLAIGFPFKGQGRVQGTAGEGHTGILGTTRKFGLVTELAVNVHLDLEWMLILPPGEGRAPRPGQCLVGPACWVRRGLRGL